jgi:flagellar biosynthetic protein FlhB
MSDADSGERTYEPTEQRREKFRKEGRHAQSKDIGGVAATVAGFGVLVAGRHSLADGARIMLVRCLGDPGAFERIGVRAAFEAASPLLVEAASMLAAAAVAGVLASGAQTRFRLNFEAVGFKPERLDLRNGLGRIFAFKKNAVQLLLSLLRTAGAGAVAYHAVGRELPRLLLTAQAPLGASVEAAGGAVGRVLAHVLLVLGLLAVVEYAVSWFTLEREMKMTRKERTDEAKQEDGDPKVKARMKARARANAKKRALTAVKTADVVVTNPTHIAVALRYGAKDVAPIVVAKGHDELALRIRSEARRAGIPVLENRPLARRLDAEVQVGRSIGQAHFAAVAQVLAFVYRLKKRGALR